MWGDIKSARLLYLKGLLFLVLGVMASVNILLLLPRWDVLASLALAIWAFSRSYYFAFYVIELYIDPHFKFAGLSSVARYLSNRPPSARAEGKEGSDGE